MDVSNSLSYKSMTMYEWNWKTYATLIVVC